MLDWIPVRLAGVVYALLGHGEKALPAWFASLADLHTSQYQVLTRLAQFSLAREPHTDKVDTPKAAVALAKNVVCGGGDYCVTDHLWDISIALCRMVLTRIRPTPYVSPVSAAAPPGKHFKAYRQAGCQNPACRFRPSAQALNAYDGWDRTAGRPQFRCNSLHGTPAHLPLPAFA